VSEVTPLAGREELWRDGLRLFQESPVIGNGFISDRRTVHNAYLEIAVKTGVLGLMCYLPLLAVAVRKSFRSRLSGDWMRAILYMGLIQAMAESHLVSYGVFSGAMFTLSLFQFITEDTPSSARRAARHSPGWGMRWCEPSLGRNF
jgi:O-antigen ligase